MMKASGKIFLFLRLLDIRICDDLALERAGEGKLSLEAGSNLIKVWSFSRIENFRKAQNNLI